MLDFLKKEKIVPVAVIEEVDKAVPLAKALLRGGIHSIEVTFRTEAAEEAIRQIVNNCEEMVAGAGTILTVEQAERAIGAGAKFIVSPALIPEVVEYCQEMEVPVIPGCVTPTEFFQARAMGLKIVKFFPAEQYGGVKTLKAIGAVFPDLAFMPTGGVNMENMKDYLAYDKVCACGGSFMVDKALVANEEFVRITDLAQSCKENI